MIQTFEIKGDAWGDVHTIFYFVNDYTAPVKGHVRTPLDERFTHGGERV